MFIPTRDSTYRLTPPFITIGLITINVLIYLYQISIPEEQLYDWFRTFGVVPIRLINGEGFFTLISSLFIHGNLLHLLGNMLYLWIFGDNIETTLGHGKFLLFYILCGIMATLSQVIIEPGLDQPVIGASGAISGVLGAYLIRYPRARVEVLIWFFIFIRRLWIPARYLLLFWFFMQLTNGLGSLSLEQSRGVAWFAHIGGFLAGIVLLYLILSYERKRIWKKIKNPN
jgi:membrane associated rhomboid family serine protease